MKNKIESCVQVLEKTLSGLQWSFPKKNSFYYGLTNYDRGN